MLYATGKRRHIIEALYATMQGVLSPGGQIHKPIKVMRPNLRLRRDARRRCQAPGTAHDKRFIHFKEPRSLAGLAAKIPAVFHPNQRAPACKTGPGRASGKTRLEASYTQHAADRTSDPRASCWAPFRKTCTLMSHTPLPRAAFTRLSCHSSHFPPST